jgi:hypothetical protein
MLGVPLIDRRQSAFVNQLLQIGDGDPLQFYRRAALRHGRLLSLQAGRSNDER